MTLSSEKLTTSLWDILDALRGEIGVEDYPPLVLSLLLLKKCSDDAEAEQSSDGWPKTVEPTGLRLPETARWSQLLESEEPENYIREAFADLSAENERWADFFDDLAQFWSNELAGKLSSSNLEFLLTRLAQFDLREENLSRPDAVGDATQELLEQFTASSGGHLGISQPPQALRELLAELADVEGTANIADITCGFGSILVTGGRKLAASGDEVELYGQEINREFWRLAHLNLLLNGFSNFQIELGDTLVEPKLMENHRLMKFDAITCNPPFGQRHGGAEKLEPDAYGRFDFGMPGRIGTEWLFVQHVLATLKPDGKAAVVLSPGAAQRGRRERNIRENVVRKGRVEAVIELPPNLYFNTGIPVMVWVFNGRPREREDVLMIQATEAKKVKTGRNRLPEGSIEKITAVYRDFEERTEFSTTVTPAELAEEDFNMMPSRYVDTFDGPDSFDYAEALQERDELRRQWEDKTARLNELLGKFEMATSS